MAVAFDTSVVGGGNGVNSLALPAITTGGTNRMLVLVTHYSNATPTGITMSGGTGLSWTQLQARISPNGNSANGFFECYYALATATQTAQVITITYTGGGFPQVSAVLAAFSGTNLTGSNGANAIGIKSTTTGTTANPSANLTTGTNNSLVLAGWGESSNAAFTAGSGQTNTTTATSTPGTTSSTVLERQNAVTATAGTVVTMNETLAAVVWAGHLLELKPPGAAITGHNLTLLGVGL